MRSVIAATAIWLALLFSASAAAVPVQVGSTVLTYTATGSPNTIAGIWNAAALDLSGSGQVAYFELEVLSFESPFGVATNMGFDSYFPGNGRSLGFGSLCPVGASCVGLASVGSVSVVDVFMSPQWMARDFLLRLDRDDPFHLTSGAATVGFNSGGNQTTASGSVRITAFGQASPVPEPATFVLASLALLIVRMRVAGGRRLQPRHAGMRQYTTTGSAG